MNWFEKILYYLDYQIEKPAMYGAYHIICLIIIISLSVYAGFIAIKNRNDEVKKEKITKIMLLSYAIGALFFELLKQLNYSFDTNHLTWDYQWYGFPMQFCSTPMYIALVAGLLKKGRVRDVMCSYLASFSLFAGTAVMLFPATIFSKTLLISIQTVICHGGMIILGVYLLCSNVMKLDFKIALKGSIIFVGFAILALVLNLIFYSFNQTEVFNMFFISPYYDCELPILTTIQENAPYIVFLIVYLLGFLLCSTIIISPAILVNKLLKNKLHKKVLAREKP